MSRFLNIVTACLIMAGAGISDVFAAGPDLGAVQRQPLNWTAIVMFLAFVLVTLGITYRAAAQTKSAADFYAAGGGITGFQNGLAIAGDYMSAASFLGHLGPRFRQRVRWPDLLHRLSGRLADRPVPDRGAVAQPRQVHVLRRRLLPPRPDPDPDSVRNRHACRGGLLPHRADGRRRQADRVAVRPGLSLCGHHRGRPDDRLRRLRRHEGDHLGADHQGVPPAGRRHLHGPDGAVAVRLQP